MQRFFCRTLRGSLTSIAAGVALAGSMVSGAQAQETLAGVSAGTAAAAGLGAMGATVAVTEAGRRAQGPGQPPQGSGPVMSGNMGAPPSGMPGMPNMPQATVTTTIVRREPVRWSTQTGEQYLSELLRARRPATTGVSAATRRARARAQVAEARRLARLTPAQRRRAMASRYRKPPVGYLAYYLPQDRYKLTSGVWKYVTIEDDQGRYPVRYYYRPSAPTMLRLLSQSPRGIRRYNRVVGFHTWQDAVLAGYRPDPVTLPEPGNQIAALASMTRGPQLARYVEFVFSGQVAPDTFQANYTYITQVRRAVVSRSHTRPLLGETVGQVLGAIMGEEPLPRSVGGSPAPAQVMSPAGISGPPSGFGGGPPPGIGGPPPGFSGGPPPGSGEPPSSGVPGGPR